MKIRNVLVIPFLLLVLTAVSCGNSKSRNDSHEGECKRKGNIGMEPEI